MGVGVSVSARLSLNSLTHTHTHSHSLFPFPLIPTPTPTCAIVTDTDLDGMPLRRPLLLQRGEGAALLLVLGRKPRSPRLKHREKTRGADP